VLAGNIVFFYGFRSVNGRNANVVQAPGGFESAPAEMRGRAASTNRTASGTLGMPTQ
jgi:hypothetical protein